MASHPLDWKTDLFEDMPDETCEVNTTSQSEVWQFFYGAAWMNAEGTVVAGVRVVLISSKNLVLSWAFLLTELCSNNVAEYNILLIGLDIATELEVKYFEAYGDFKLVINWITGEYEVRNVDLISYHEAAIKLADSFECFYIDHVPRRKNTHADTLAALAATLAQHSGMSQRITVASRQLFRPKYAL